MHLYVLRRFFLINNDFPSSNPAIYSMSKIDISDFLWHTQRMEQRNISITPELLAHAEAMVATGRYANVSDYMRALIRRDHEQEEANAWLRQMHREAVESGDAVEVTPDQLGELIRRGIDKARLAADKDAG